LEALALGGREPTDDHAVLHTDRPGVRVERAGLVAVHAHVRLPCVEGNRQDPPGVRVLAIQPSSVVCSIGEGAADFKAARSIGGSAFPRLSARRRIPAHAFGLKKNRPGTSRASSSTCDNEHTASSLGDGTRVSVHSHILRVQDSVGPPIPEFAQHPEEGAKRPSVV